MALNGFRGGEEVAVTVVRHVRLLVPVVKSTTGVGRAVVVAVTLGADSVQTADEVLLGKRASLLSGALHAV